MTTDEALRQAIERAVDTPWLRDDPRDARTQLVDALIAAVRAEYAESAETLRALRDEVAGLHVYGIPSGSPLEMAADEGWDRAVKAILGLISERQDAALAATPAEGGEGRT